ncbi:MAG TPA: helix-turn-helix domain-containing protein [Rudaea sp.]|nr:helix-turn-helix domain-containing protein [Rudaea sp.]
MTYRAKHDRRNGLLHFRASQALAGYARYFPSAALAAFVEHYWTVEWRLAEPTLRETLPYPSAHIVLEPGVSVLAGVTTRKFSRVLEGESRVFGVKFRPGGLRPFVTQPVSAFTDRMLDLADVFGRAAAHLDARVLAHRDHHACIAVLEGFLLDRAPQRDPAADLAARVCERIAADRGIRLVEDVLCETGLGPRKLQRLFSEYVGVAPKWVIRRYRLHDAAERMTSATHMEWAALAQELGYADQAHFIRDFKRLIGQPPAEYFKHLVAGEAKSDSPC